MTEVVLCSDSFPLVLSPPPQIQAVECTNTVCSVSTTFLSAGSLLPRAATELRSAQGREGHQLPSAVACRPQRERRQPRKLADAAVLCIEAVQSTGERLSVMRRLIISPALHQSSNSKKSTSDISQEKVCQHAGLGGIRMETQSRALTDNL